MMRSNMRYCCAAMCAVGALMRPGRDGAAETFYASVTGDDGAPGTLEQPLATLQKGVDRLQPGDSLVVLPGIYRQSILLGELKGTADAPITIRAAVPGTVFLSGSVPVAKWAQVPGTRFAWRADLAGAALAVYERDTNVEYAEQTDLYVLDGEAGSFLHDEEKGVLYVHASDDAAPATHLVDASVLETGIDGLSGGPANWHISLRKHLIIDGFVLAGYSRAGIHIMRADGCEVRNCTVHHCGAGVFFHSSIRSAIRDCDVSWCYDKTDNEGGGVAFQGTSFDNVIARCVVHDIIKYGIRHYGGGFVGSSIRECLVYRAGRGAIQTKGVYDTERRYADRFSPPASGAPLRVEHNVIIEPGNPATGLLDAWGARQNTLGGTAVTYRDGDAASRATQLCFTPELLPAQKFADPERYDYRLQSDSPHRATGAGAFAYGGNVFFVKPDGDDAADGASVAAAWKTFGTALGRLRPGSTLYLLPGSYAGGALTLSGPETVMISARGKDRVELVGSGAGIGLALSGAGNVRLRGLSFVGWGQGLAATPEAGLHVESCLFAGQKEAGIRTQGPLTVIKSVFFQNGTAVESEGDAAAQVYGCVFAGNGTALRAAKGPLSNFNVFRDGKTAEMAGQRFASLAAWQAFSAQDSESLEADPLFRNPDQGDFGLQPGSPCLGRGYLWSPAGMEETPRSRATQGGEIRYADASLALATPTTATLTWRTIGGKTTSLVRYGTDPGRLDKSVEMTAGQHLTSSHAITLFELSPSTTYYYQIGHAPYRFLYADRLAEPVDPSPPTWDPEIRSFTTPATFIPRRRTLYLDARTGSDGHDGLSPETAFASLHKVSQEAQPGDRVVIAAGAYHGVLQPVHTGLPDAPIVFEAAPGARVELSGKRLAQAWSAVIFGKRHITLKGFVFKEHAKMLPDDVGLGSQIAIGDSRDIRVEKCLFDGRMYYMTAIWIFRSADVVFDNNIVYPSSNYTSVIATLNEGPVVFTHNTFSAAKAATEFGVFCLNKDLRFTDNLVGEKLSIKWGSPMFQLDRNVRAVFDHNYYAFVPTNLSRFALRVRLAEEDPWIESGGADPLAQARELGLELHGKAGLPPWRAIETIHAKTAAVRGVMPRDRRFPPFETGDFALADDAPCRNMASDGGDPGKRQE